MTVCVALIYEKNTVVCASDRMISTQDVGYEPPTPKIYPLTSAIVAMTAGDVALQAEIRADVMAVLYARIAKEPKNWWAVSDVAELWRGAFVRARQKRATATYLEPLGLDMESFTKRQAGMSQSVVHNLVDQLFGFRCGGIGTIITGIDMTGAHIYVVDNDQVACHDTIGFAAIGNGGSHANSQLMLSKYGSERTPDEALLLAYTAKKRAEVAPGVGREIDMYIVGPRLGNSFPIVQDRILELDAMYKRMVRHEQAAFQRAKRSAKTWLDAVGNTGAPQGQNVAAGTAEGVAVATATPPTEPPNPPALQPPPASTDDQ